MKFPARKIVVSLVALVDLQGVGAGVASAAPVRHHHKSASVTSTQATNSTGGGTTGSSTPNVAFNTAAMKTRMVHGTW